ncbi:MAG TPA: hypothetical protein VK991_05260, partial [Halomonas sp.]|nr:hypothetical protein [Halomonas sp.]
MRQAETGTPWNDRLLPNNILHLPEYFVLGNKVEEHDLHFQVEAPAPIACEECGVEGELVRF